MVAMEGMQVEAEAEAEESKSEDGRWGAIDLCVQVSGREEVWRRMMIKS